ncbi:MAG: hypothetical protein AB9888_08150 [Bacteroidales bacterium]
MRDIEFSNWLVNVDGRDKRQMSDNVSRAKRVEEALSNYLRTEVNLDFEYQKDKCNLVLEMLSMDYVSKIAVAINLPKDKNGLSSLKTSINKYIRFCNEYY